jgi:hypothetical protein
MKSISLAGVRIGQSRGPARKLSNRDIVILLAITLAVLCFGVRAAIRSSVVRPFAGHLNEYNDIPGLKNAFPESRDDHFGGGRAISSERTGGYGRPYVTGKVIPVNKAANKVDNLYFSLPKTFRATKPEEVGTIV